MNLNQLGTAPGSLAHALVRLQNENSVTQVHYASLTPTFTILDAPVVIMARATPEGSAEGATRATPFFSLP
ncbi:hypothetical protein CYMTET_18853 [Cymbomonas tetramitiformis]|uniref:Uncharacterized protein n=1 Tax=Cymbomonas tetramitiformis TaxID=36881 RepID=A0AAE0G8J6_9CHLO|nr:hypothetical protein CYMTET_18853 [Cymbomonas tetramitiformis]